MRTVSPLKKSFLLFLLLFHISQSSLSQTNVNIARFTHSLMRKFNAFASHTNDTAPFTQALLVFQINDKYNCNRAFFTDSAPGWQKEELKRVLPKIDLNEICQYAKAKKFSGNLIFSFMVKSEFIKDAVDEFDVFDNFASLFSQNGTTLRGNFLILPPIGITVGRIIRCYRSAKEYPLPNPIQPRY